LARKLGYTGSDSEVALVDAIAEGVFDFQTKGNAAVNYPIEAERPSKIEKFFKEEAPKWLQYFADILEEDSYLVGTSVTYADFKLFNVLNRMVGMAGGKEAIQAFPTLVAFRDRIAARPRIKAYYDRNPYKLP